MNALENLTKARALISDPARWTQGYAARNAFGTPTGASQEGAACWCAIGACVHVANDMRSDVIRLLSVVIGNPRIGTFNDSHTHAEVLHAFDQAITLAKAGGL